MKQESVYLKPNVVMEPLFNQWYAWTNLVAPATAAMYVANLHLKLMQSFVAAPQIHVSALKNPAMLGGPFINYGADRVGAVKRLLEETARHQAHMVGFAEAVKSLDKVLTEGADGLSLEAVYRKVPEALKGYVELVYDLNNQPSVRFIEGLLYRSPYYDAAAQSVALSLVERDDRSFVFSTPRLPREGWLNLRVPFDDGGLDELFRMRHEPRPLGPVCEALGVGEQDLLLFSSFFTEAPPPPAPRYDGEGVRVRYFGHACVLFETRDVSVLCDPVISYDIETSTPRYAYSDLPETIDYVVITHNHQDHCMFETLLQLRHKIRNIVVPKNNGGGLADPSMKLVLKHVGFRNVIELDEMEELEVPGGSITGLPFLGEHADLHIRTKLAYAIRLNGRSIVCAADSENLEPELYRKVHDVTGDVDAVFIGMECDGAPLSWLYGPLLSKPLARKVDQSRRSNGSDYEKAIQLVERLNPKQVYVYAMGQEPWLTYLTSIQYTQESRPIVESDKLVAECLRRGLVSERLFGQKEILLEAAPAHSSGVGSSLPKVPEFALAAVE
jgi:L-ascorbate metabolism protein UlaG (beta-lactamase superfamily)